MSFVIKTTTKIEDAADFIALSILKQLKLKKRVLFFVAGGSSISVAVQVSKILKKTPHKNLTIMLTDERYGAVDHFNSNYYQLVEKGFNLPEAKIIPVLTGSSRFVSNKKFNINLDREFKLAKYKIGLFGIGVDGHTAGILPNSVAVHSKELACDYDTAIFSRITMTPKAIKKLDEAVVFAEGKDKWRVIKNLEKEIDVKIEPAQILKKVPLLTIFTDYKKI